MCGVNLITLINYAYYLNVSSEFYLYLISNSSEIYVSAVN